MNEYYLWLFARILGSYSTRQIMPGFGGFISVTGKTPPRKSTINYFTPIHQPFTEYSTIKELLKRSQDATMEVVKFLHGHIPSHFQ